MSVRRSRPALWLGVVSLSLLLTGLAVPSSAAPAAPADPRCLPGQQAVAHAGGAQLRRQPADAPVPCATTTTSGTAEASVRATRAALFQAPGVFPDGEFPPAAADLEQVLLPPSAVKPFAATLPAGVNVSRDRGRTWSLVEPGGQRMFTFDHGSYADVRTGRYFLSAYLPTFTPEQTAEALLHGVEVFVHSTADEGRTWTTSTVCCAHQSENPEFVVNTAPPGQPQPQGYPHVVYFCFNATNAIVYGTRLCTSSLDGGRSWAPLPTSIALSGDREACGPTGPAMSGWPQAGRNGAVLAVFDCDGLMVLGVSTDLTRTWELVRDRAGALVPVPGPVDRTSPLPALHLRTDRSGTLYAAYERDGRLLYHVSRDAGRSWSPLQDATAPGVRPVVWNVAVGERGHVAFTGLGNRRAPGGGWREQRDGFVTETRDGLSARPVFWTGIVNHPDDPLMHSAVLQGATRASERLDWTKTDIGPDGTAWAALWQDCGPSRDAPRCVAQQNQTRGYLGWLAWPGAARR